MHTRFLSWYLHVILWGTSICLLLDGLVRRNASDIVLISLVRKTIALCRSNDYYFNVHHRLFVSMMDTFELLHIEFNTVWKLSLCTDKLLRISLYETTFHTFSEHTRILTLSYYSFEIIE